MFVEFPITIRREIWIDQQRTQPFLQITNLNVAGRLAKNVDRWSNWDNSSFRTNSEEKEE